ERYAELMEIQQEISLAKNLAKIGTTRRVLIDEVDWANLTAVGRTAGDSPEIDNEVILEDLGSALSPGHFLTAEIIDATEYELYAKPENTV
ncbi:MAG: TRAM domain-containing protein, partial [Calditrichaeota bacterium]|nr:TRAM domain-containing protein [Calditrichota bacterium]